MVYMIKTSVIIPVYNTALYLEECINSVYNQTQKEIEVIVINDGSTDNSWSVLQQLKETYPEMILITQENKSLGYTRNIGIQIARGEYIFFLDSDDYILPDTLEICYEMAHNNSLDMVFFDANEFEDAGEKNEVIRNSYDRHLIIEERNEIFSGVFFLKKYSKKHYSPSCCTIYFSSKFILANNLKFMTGVYYEDNEFYCKALSLANRIMYIPKIFYQIRKRQISITRSGFNLRKVKDYLKVINAISELRSLREGKAWNDIRDILKGILFSVANDCMLYNFYEEDKELVSEILGTCRKIYNAHFVEIKDIKEIVYYKNLYSMLPLSEVENDNIEIKKRYLGLLEENLRKLPINKKGEVVLIYGIGEYTERWLNVYEKMVGDISVDVRFVDSYIVDPDYKYRERPVYNVKSIPNENINCIIISSPKYEEQMRTMLISLYGNRFKIFSAVNDFNLVNDCEINYK